jgi:hypothetical protein
MGFERQASRAIMAAPWEEPSMRKLIGLFFLTATLAATTAHAQGIFIDRGDPSAISASAGFKYLTDSSMGGALIVGWSYRGVFDVGADVTYLKYKGGSVKDLAGISATPFLTWHVMRGEEEDLPVSISLGFGVMREFFMGNAPVTNPEAWGGYFGPSVFRRIELGTRLVFVPELLAAYDLKVTRQYSSALDQTSGNRSDLSGASGYQSEMKHGIRGLAKLNFMFKAGNTKYLAVPYGGYHGGAMGGVNLGALF